MTWRARECWQIDVYYRIPRKFPHVREALEVMAKEAGLCAFMCASWHTVHWRAGYGRSRVGMHIS